MSLVRPSVHPTGHWRQTTSVLSSGLPQGARCGRAPLGGRRDLQGDADRRCATERLCRNARFGSRSHLATPGSEAREPVPVALTERYDDALGAARRAADRSA
jgi:hypothetical protein